jgi:hypothetical protein
MSLKFEVLEKVNKYKKDLLNKSDRDVLSYLLVNKLKENKCGICNIKPEWNKKPLDFLLDRVDKKARNNDLINLRLLCPYCYSQVNKKNNSLYSKFKPNVTECIDCHKKIKSKKKKCRDTTYEVFRCQDCLLKATSVDTNIEKVI